jgi:dUTP pyrophosphatase
MQKIKVRILNKTEYPNPEYASLFSAGVDLRAFVPAPIVIFPGERMLIPTGLHIGLPEGYEAQIRPRSGLALKKGITVLNTPGTIDADYRGEIGVILMNMGNESLTINPGERIAQMVLKEFSQFDWENVNSLELLGETDRGGGFGHSGVK